MKETNKQKSNVTTWLKREDNHKLKAIENASRYFDKNDELTVNMLEAVYGQESSFGTMQGKRGTSGAAGHFQLKKATAEKYNLVVSKDNDQRFDIDYASSAIARYLKDLDNMFVKPLILLKELPTISVESASERKKFVLGADNGGEGRIARAQHLAEQAGKDPQAWDDVKEFLEEAGATKNKAKEICDYVDNVLAYEDEFSAISPADKDMKNKDGIKPGTRCTDGHWVTIDDHHVFICDQKKKQ